MIDNSLHSNILTAVISDPNDRGFITTVRTFMDTIKDPNEDEESTKTILKNIISNGITDKDEVIFNIASEPYSDKVIKNVLSDVNYSQSYKTSLLAKLNMQKCIMKFEPFKEEITKCLDIMDREGGNKRGETALKNLMNSATEMHKASQDFMLGNTASNVMIFNPNAPAEDLGVYISLAETMDVSNNNKVKTIPVIDNMLGGGAVPGSLYLTPGISGKGKSLIMQNLALYACKNNNPEDFVTNGLTPCSVFVSYEMDFRQCSERTLAWLGLPVPVRDPIKTSKAEFAAILKQEVEKGFKKFGINIPIIYLFQNTDGDVELPDAGTIEAEVEKLKNTYGLFPILLTVDYLDRMDLRNRRLKSMGESGAEGAAKIRLKARELRDVGKRKNIAIITATQLDADAMNKCDRMEPFQKKFDICLEFGMGNVSGSKNLRAEVEDVLIVHKFDVETKDPNTDQKKTMSFISVKQEKDRDGKSLYKLSPRDKENFHQYQNYTQLLKNSSNRDMLKLTTKAHAVIPMEGFRMLDDDWAMSIRMFYPNENSDFVSLSNLVNTTISSLNDDDLNSRMEEMFEADLLPDDEREGYDDIVI